LQFPFDSNERQQRWMSLNGRTAFWFINGIRPNCASLELARKI